MPNPPIWPVKPLANGKDTPLSSNPGTLPNLMTDLANWFQPIYMEHVTKSIINFQVVETTSPIQFQGIVQQFSTRQLAMKPEGQRAWDWRSVICWPHVSLSPDDVVVWQGQQFRVMAKLDWGQYGFVEYHLSQDYQGAGPTVL